MQELIILTAIVAVYGLWVFATRKTEPQRRIWQMSDNEARQMIADRWAPREHHVGPWVVGQKWGE